MQIKDKNTDKALVWKADAVFQTNKYFGNDRVDACVADLDSFLADKLAGLQEEAQALADEFWEVHIKTNKTKSSKRSRSSVSG